MIFSNKIYKINSGYNATLYAESLDKLNLYLFNKTLKKYQIQLNNYKNCVFIKQYNHKKIIQLNTNKICTCANGFITIENETAS